MMSTPIIPQHPSRQKEGTLTHRVKGGHYWTRKPPLRGSLLPANLQTVVRRRSAMLPAGIRNPRSWSFWRPAMAKYTVHLYPVVRVTLDGIEALTKQEAIEKALDEIATSCYEHLGS